jgi:hypothetical protein
MEGPNFSKYLPIPEYPARRGPAPAGVPCLCTPAPLLPGCPACPVIACPPHRLLSSYPWCLSLCHPVSLASPTVGVSVPLLSDPVHPLPAALPYRVLDGPVPPALVPGLQNPAVLANPWCWDACAMPSCPWRLPLVAFVSPGIGELTCPVPGSVLPALVPHYAVTCPELHPSQHSRHHPILICGGYCCLPGYPMLIGGAPPERKISWWAYGHTPGGQRPVGQ